MLDDALNMLQKKINQFNQSSIIELMLFQRESLTMISYEFYNKLRHSGLNIFTMREFEDFVKEKNELTRVKYILVARYVINDFKDYAKSKFNETN